MNHILIGSLDQGGAERQVSYLSQKDFIDTVFSFTNINFYQVDKHRSILSIFNMNKIALLLFAPFALAIRISSRDTVISFMELSNVINILTKLIKRHNAIVSVRTNLNRFKSSFIKYTFLKLIILLYKFSNLIIINSEEGKSILVQLGLPQDKIKVVVNALDLDSIKKLQTSKKAYKSILYCGRFNSVKNIHGLLNVFKELNSRDPEYRLCLIGDGPLRNEIEEYLINNNLTEKVDLVGLQKNPFNYFYPGSILLLTSFNEGLPNVLIEAMACGLPIISSDCKTGPSEIIKDKYGVLLPIPINTTDYKLWVNSILNVNENYDYYKKLSIERANMFELNTIMNTWKSYIS
ncbi:glycosyltransferase [Halobacteriovorax sp. XZX-3]|uniref:glycosyltransferase n=1 Tax=unclassified Halobacteriovorax TaxID=2639665 RepID=UPI00371F84CD